MWSGGGWRSGATAGYFTSSHTLAHTWGAEGGTERGEEGRRGGGDAHFKGSKATVRNQWLTNSDFDDIKF